MMRRRGFWFLSLMGIEVSRPSGVWVIGAGVELWKFQAAVRELQLQVLNWWKFAVVRLVIGPWRL